METAGIRHPKQTRSEHTLERILRSGTALIEERSYDEVTIADIAARADISVGGFYSRFSNKEALFSALQLRLGEETESRAAAALAEDWSSTSLLELVRVIVAGNVELYRKYRGVLTVVHLRTRVLRDDDEQQSITAHNERLVGQLTALMLKKRTEITHQKARQAIRVAIACMSSMLRDAIVFNDTSLYPEPKDHRVITRVVAQVMYRYLAGDST